MRLANGVNVNVNNAVGSRKDLDRLKLTSGRRTVPSQSININTNTWSRRASHLCSTFRFQLMCLYNIIHYVDLCCALSLTPASVREAPERCSAPAKKRCFPKCSCNTSTAPQEFRHHSQLWCSRLTAFRVSKSID